MPPVRGLQVRGVGSKAPVGYDVPFTERPRASGLLLLCSTPSLVTNHSPPVVRLGTRLGKCNPLPEQRQPGLPEPIRSQELWHHTPVAGKRRTARGHDTGYLGSHIPRMDYEGIKMLLKQADEMFPRLSHVWLDAGYRREDKGADWALRRPWRRTGAIGLLLSPVSRTSRDFNKAKFAEFLSTRLGE